MELASITSEDILKFMASFTNVKKQSTKKPRFTLLSVFFNFIKTTINQEFQNPCDSPALRKLFKTGKKTQYAILEKDMVDEIIFRTENQRNRIMLELMARSCMRVGEVLKLTPKDIEDRKIIIRNPNSGKESEAVFLPLKVSERIKTYIRDKEIPKDARTFPITYAAARRIVIEAGEMVGADIRPHDLRRHAATYASRSGTPLEIISKVLLRHSNLSTNQMYLGKISDAEAIRWIDRLHG